MGECAYVIFSDRPRRTVIAVVTREEPTGWMTQEEFEYVTLDLSAPPAATRSRRCSLRRSRPLQVHASNIVTTISAL